MHVPAECNTPPRVLLLILTTRRMCATAFNIRDSFAAERCSKGTYRKRYSFAMTAPSLFLFPCFPVSPALWDCSSFCLSATDPS